MRKLSILVLAILTVPCLAATINVNWDGTGDYTTIQAGIDAAVSGVDTVEVAEGTYNENINFGGKNIILTSTDPNNPAATIIDGGSGSVVTFAGSETADCILRGFTITNGHTSADGGGICGNGNQAVISNCEISGNQTRGEGGGLFDCDGVIINCTISNNSATQLPFTSDVVYGGGLSQCDGLISNCIISFNYSYGTWSPIMMEPSGSGGGLAWCQGTISNCTITNNEVDGSYNRGGGLYGCDGTIINCLISDNTVNDHSGGGLSSCNGPIINCTIVGNTANEAGGLSWCSGITNCIIWNNNAVTSSDQMLSCSVPAYSCIQSWTGGGIGNITDNPNFVAGPFGDYYLSQTAAGQGVNSPCADTGSDTAVNLGMDVYTTRSDQAFDTGMVDMGYHYNYILQNIADFNDSGKIDNVDFAILHSQWQGAPGSPSADVAPAGGNGVVDIDDLRVLAENWLWP